MAAMQEQQTTSGDHMYEDGRVLLEMLTDHFEKVNHHEVVDYHGIQCYKKGDRMFVYPPAEEETDGDDDSVAWPEDSDDDDRQVHLYFEPVNCPGNVSAAVGKPHGKISPCSREVKKKMHSCRSSKSSSRCRTKLYRHLSSSANHSHLWDDQRVGEDGVKTMAKYAAVAVYAETYEERRKWRREQQAQQKDKPMKHDASGTQKASNKGTQKGAAKTAKSGAPRREGPYQVTDALVPAVSRQQDIDVAVPVLGRPRGLDHSADDSAKKVSVFPSLLFL